MATGCIDSPGRLYWELRPHYRYPTLEFRTADVTPRLEDAVAIAALARALVIAAALGELREPDLPDSHVLPFLGENAWRASRYGVAAEVIDLSGGTPRALPLAEWLGELLEALEPLMREAGDESAIESLGALLERGNAAGRMRDRITRAGEGMPELVRWLADETVLGLGMDRRAEQRNG